MLFSFQSLHESVASNESAEGIIGPGTDWMALRIHNGDTLESTLFDVAHAHSRAASRLIGTPGRRQQWRRGAYEYARHIVERAVTEGNENIDGG